MIIPKRFHQILAIPYLLLKSFFTAFRALHYNSKDKFEICRILILLHLKDIFCKEKGVISLRIFNYKVYGYSFQNLHYLFKEIFINHEYRYNTEHESPLIIDCGANIGMASLYFRKMVPSCRIIAIEPNPHSYILLRRNIEENHLEGITTFNACLSDKQGEVSFFINHDKGSLVGSIIESRGGQQEIKVVTLRLSELIQSENPELIKIDVEGSEKKIINDLVDSGRLKNANNYIIEFHHNMKGSGLVFSDFLSVFEKERYVYSIKSNFKLLYGYQDILVYFSLVPKDVNPS